MSFLNRLLRAGETKLVKRLGRIADHVDSLEADMQDLTDAELRAKTEEFRERHEAGESLDELLPERSPSSARARAGRWGGSVPTRCRSWVVPRCTWETSPRCVPVRARP